MNSGIVTIVYRHLPHYRIPFYEELRIFLAQRGIKLRLVYGQPMGDEVAKRDTGDIEWGLRITNRVVPIGRHGLYWQPCWRQLRGSDLIIVEQASRLLLNYILLAGQHLGGPRVAFWGHGRNFQEHDASRLGESLKQRVSRLPHWWFAYTETSARIVRALGFPSDRITVVQNAVDTRSLIDEKASLDERDLHRVRARHALIGRNVGVFVGGLYAEKRVAFLMEAAHGIRRRIGDFELLVVGDGPDASLVREASGTAPWIHWIGPRFGVQKVPYCMMAKAMLLPGLVGLAVVDAFALELPVVTIDVPYHSPEIEYLQHGVNGLILEATASPERYAEAVASLLTDPQLEAHLRQGCREAARTYTLQAMVERFGGGVVDALAA